MLVKGQLIEACFEQLLANPANAFPGRIYTDINSPTAAFLWFYNGTTWVKIPTGSYTIPTVTLLTATTLSTFTTPVGALYLRWHVIGGGGGGAGSGSADGTGQTNGSPTLVKDSSNTVTYISCGGGVAGTRGASTGAAAGGTPTVATFTTKIAMAGNAGLCGDVPTTSVTFAGKPGGAGPFGGNGGGSNTGTVSVAANSGSGGPGGGGTSTIVPGGGGGAGAYVEALVGAPAATYKYQVGAGGTRGTAGTGGSNGGAGADGQIIVEAFFQ